MVETLPIPNLHLEYRIWMAELDFAKEEISIFEQHLVELVSKNTKLAVIAQVEHFRNRFIQEKQVIDHLKHNLHLAEKRLADFVHQMSGIGIDHVRMDNHPRLREEMITFRELFTELKAGFRRFKAACYRGFSVYETPINQKL